GGQGATAYCRNAVGCAAWRARTPVLDGGDLHACVVEARALCDVRVVRGTQRRDRLAVIARAEPRALQRADDTAGNDLRDEQRQVDLAEVVPHAHARAVGEAARLRVLRVHLE